MSAACVVAVVGSTFTANARAGNVQARWVAPVSGDWTDPARWTSNPFYPNNGSPAEAVYQVRLDVPGPDYTVTLNAPVDVGSTLIGSPAATLVQAGGTFDVGTLTIGYNGVGRHRMTGGTLTVNQLGVGYAADFSSASLNSDGWFEQSAGWLEVGGASTYVGWRSATQPGHASGTLVVSGGGSRYAAVAPSSGQQVHYIGVGSAATGVARLSNFASVTLGRVEVGGSQGTGTMLVDTGAKASVTELSVGQSSGGGGAGTVIVSGGGSTRLTLGTGHIRIGSPGGSGNIVVNGGTVTMAAVAPPVVSFFIVGPGGTFSVNGGVVESQRLLYVNGGQFIVNGGSVSMPAIRVAPAGFHPPIGVLAQRGGSLSAGSVSLLGGSYDQTGGVASLGLMEMNPGGEYTFARPTARLAGGTFDATGLYVSSGTFTYQGGIFDVGFLSVSGARFVATPGRDKTLRVGSLSISGQGRLDLGDNGMLLDSGADPPLTSIRALIASGYNGGAWDGPGIMSSVAQASAAHGIGYVQPSPLFTALLVAYTRYGDANVDGAVDLADFNALAENFGTGDEWFEGDFNYDGDVNLRDFNLMAANFGLTARGPGVSPGDWAALAAAVPEPATGLLVLATLPLLRRRRKS